MKAMLDRVANEQDALKKAERQAGEKRTKLLSDTSMMKQSELWKMAVDDRVRSLLKGESSQKGKGKGKGNGKNQINVYSQKLCSLHQDNNGPLSEDQVEQSDVAKKKKTANHQRELDQIQARPKHQAKDRNRGMERALAKERSRAKRKARSNHKRRRARTKARALERASERKVSPPKERDRAKAKTRKVSQVWRIQQRLETCTLR